MHTKFQGISSIVTIYLEGPYIFVRKIAQFQTHVFQFFPYNKFHCIIYISNLFKLFFLSTNLEMTLQIPIFLSFFMKFMLILLNFNIHMNNDEFLCMLLYWFFLKYESCWECCLFKIVQFIFWKILPKNHDV